MFYEGAVQNGIATALQTRKSVVCFVTDNSAESKLWETEWLEAGSIPQTLADHAICLKLASGSPEAAQLAAFYPVSEIPTVLVIFGGSIVDQIIRGTTKEDFTARLKRAIDPSTPESDSSSGVSSVQTSVPSSAPTSQPERPSTVPHPTSSTQRASAGRAGGNDAVPTITPNVSATDTSTSSPPGRPQEDSYARQQVRRKQEAMQERDRVRSLIEADKQERKAREERRRAEALAQSAPPEQDRSEARTEKRATSAQCGIQVRLLDGSTIRQRFKAQDNLQSAVRSFVDSNRTDGTAPYTFKLVLTPHPSRAVNESEEKFSFEKLGLLPGVSLALIPVKNLAHAYQTGGSRGFIRSAPLLLYGYLVAVLAYINLTIRTLLGIAAGTDQRRGNEQMDNQRTTRSTQAKGDTVVPNGSEPDKPGMRIRTLNDQKDRADDKQFYNGNQLNFEPNKKDKDAKD